MPKSLRGLGEHGILEKKTGGILEDPKSLAASIRGGIEDSKVVCR